LDGKISQTIVPTLDNKAASHQSGYPGGKNPKPA
jgi:hypothetical protein